jgi:hypothetical protein
MSYKNIANSTFSKFTNKLHSNDYTVPKAVKSVYCTSNNCKTNEKVYSQSNYINLKKLQLFNELKNDINHNQLYINLITKLDLTGNIPIISDLSNNYYPAIIDTSANTYLTYNIDPSGILFGNTVCNIDNWKKLIVYNDT